MRDVPRFPIETGFPILAGLLWLMVGASSGVFGFVLSVVPGSLLLAGGVVTLFLSGEERAPQLAANGGVVGLVLALPIALSTGVWIAGLLLLLSAASFVAAGWTSRRYAPSHVDVPDPQTTPLLAAKVALDEVNVSAILIARSSPLVRISKSGPGIPAVSSRDSTSSSLTCPTQTSSRSSTSALRRAFTTS